MTITVNDRATRAQNNEDIELQTDDELTLTENGGPDLPYQGYSNLNLVDWDGQDDPECPYNWPRWRIMTNASILSVMTFLVPLTSCELEQPSPIMQISGWTMTLTN